MTDARAANGPRIACTTEQAAVLRISAYATTVTGLDLSEQVTIADRGEGVRTVPGLAVAPGLVVTAWYDREKNPVPRRYILSHAPSGLSLALGAQCATHVLEAVEALVASSIDFTQDKDAVLACKDPLVQAVTSHRDLCDNLHYSCPGDPDPYEIRCRTCGWEYDPEDAEGGAPPTTDREAQAVADEHECDPWIEIRKPGAKTWQPRHVFINR